ncbi:MAG TPA: hypothetical protein PLD62_10430, partial [Candidatus Cloacimonadota bacterium]|nr:hypothetical protein [Candidatus Cloacimonadota bacterium]
MSNKFRNILLRLELLLLFLSLTSIIYGFTPEQRDFSNKYQYDLYRSWLQKNSFFTQFAAGCSQNLIVKNFGDKQDKIEV